MISSRKVTIPPSLTTVRPVKKAVIPKKHEKSAKISDFSAAKRGMPEVPIFRPDPAVHQAKRAAAGGRRMKRAAAFVGGMREALDHLRV